MTRPFLQSYFERFDDIEGWFSRDAALMFMAYHELVAAQDISGSVLEIGVHHGRSSIAIAAIRGPGAGFVAIDLFEGLQAHNLSASGHGSRAHFDRNMSAFFEDTRFIRRIAAASNTLTPESIGTGFSFCHVDGGHSAAETCADLELCSRVLLPGGLLALDDYFNPAYPGVCEGAIKFWMAQPPATALVPIAQGFNKVLFQKQPAPGELNRAFDERFAAIPHKTITMWERPVYAFGSFVAFIDIARSTPRALVPATSDAMDAVLVPGTSAITAEGGATIHVPVRVLNRSTIPFGVESDAPFGLSYHLLSNGGRDVQFDNIRSYFTQPLEPNEERTVNLAVEVPRNRGDYTLEVDIVWEGIAWLKHRGLETPLIELRVI